MRLRYGSTLRVRGESPGPPETMVLVVARWRLDLARRMAWWFAPTSEHAAMPDQESLIHLEARSRLGHAWAVQLLADGELAGSRDTQLTWSLHRATPVT